MLVCVQVWCKCGASVVQACVGEGWKSVIGEEKVMIGEEMGEGARVKGRGVSIARVVAVRVHTNNPQKQLQ